LQINDIISSGLLELYVLGLTNEQETAQVLAWKAQYPEVGAELTAIEDSLEQLDFAKAKAPSTDAKQKLFANLKSNNNSASNTETKIVSLSSTTIAPVKNINSNLKYAVAASIALLIGSAIFNMLTYTKYNKVSKELASAQEKLSAQQNDIARLQNNLEVPLNNSSQQVVLKGTPAAPPNSTAKIFWIRNTGDVYVEASGLPETPKGMQYQLWAIIDGKPVDAGMISYDKKGQKYNIQKMKSFGKAQAFAITLEKEGGSPTPTMEKLYVMSEV
jgi:hypothetical protein